VLYSRDGRLFAHRVVACLDSPGQPLLITRGDRLNHDDPAVCSAELLGRVTFIKDCGGRGVRRLESRTHRFGPNYLMLSTLRTSDRATYLYLQLVALWRAFSLWRANCRA